MEPVKTQSTMILVMPGNACAQGLMEKDYEKQLI